MSSQEAQIPEPAPETIIKDYDEEKLKLEKESKDHLVEGEIFSGPSSNAAVISEVLQIPEAISQVSVNPKQDQVVIDEYQSDETQSKREKEVDDESNVGASAEIASPENVVDIGSVTNGAYSDELVAKNDPETSIENNEDESPVVAEQDVIQSIEPEDEKEKAEVYLPTEKGEDKEEENAVSSTKDDHNEAQTITESQPEDEAKKQEEVSIQDVGGVNSRDESEYQENKATIEVQIPPEAEETKLTDKAEEDESASAEYTETTHEKEAVEDVPTSEIKKENQEIEHKPAEEDETENDSAEYTETSHEKEAVEVVPTSEIKQEDQDIEHKTVEEDETENASAEYTEITPEKEAVEDVQPSEIKDTEDKAAEVDETENASVEYTDTTHEREAVEVVQPSEIKQEDQDIEDKAAEEDETENASAEYTETAHEKEAVDVVPTSEIKQEDQDIEDEGQHPLLEEVISRDYIEGGVPIEQHTSTDDKLDSQRDDETAKEEALTDSQIDNNLTGEDEKTENTVEEEKFVEQNEDVEVQADSSAHHPIDEIPKDKELSGVVEENAETTQIEKDDEESKGIAAIDSQPNNELQKEDKEEAYQEGESAFDSKIQDYEGVDQAQIPSEVEETKPEQDVEEVAVVKTEKNLVEVVTQLDENVNEALDEKLKEKEVVQNKDVDFFVEEATAESSIKDDTEEEQETTIEEKSEIKEEDETEKIEQEDDGQVDDDKEEVKPKETVDNPLVAEEIEKVADQEDEEEKKLDSSEEQSSNDRNIVSDAVNTEIIDKHEIEQIPEDIPELHESVILHASEEPEIEKEAVKEIIESQPDEEKAIGEGTSVQEEGEIDSTDVSIAHEHSVSGETAENLEEAGAIETEALNAKINEEGKLKNKDEDRFVEQATAESFVEEEETAIAEKSEIKEEEAKKFEKDDDEIKKEEAKPEETVDDPEVAEEKIVEAHEVEVEQQLDSSNKQSSKDGNIVLDAENTEITDKHEIEQIPEDLHELHESVISHTNRELEIEKETVNKVIESQPEEETSKHGEGEGEGADVSIDQASLSKSEETVENLEEARERETESEAISQSDETAIEKETVDIGISNEKIKKEEEDEVKQDKDLQLPSSVEEGNAESFLEDGIKQEQETNTEDKYETTNTIEQPSSLESEFVEENIPAEEERKITEEVTATSYSEQVQGLHHASVQAESEDTLEKIKTETVTSDKALEEFESRHEPEIQQYESTTQAQDLEKVEEIKVEENPEAEAEKKAEHLVEASKSLSDETAHEKEELEVEIPRQKEDEVAHEVLHSHVDEEETTSCIEDGVKQEQDAVTEAKKGDEEENTKKDVAAGEDETDHVPASTEEDENTIKESHAEESENSGDVKIEEVTTGLDSKEGLALAQEPSQLEHGGSAEKTEEKVEDEKHYDISDLEEALTTESSQHDTLIEENKAEESYKVIQEASEKEKIHGDLTEAKDYAAEPLTETSREAEPLDAIEMIGENLERAIETVTPALENEEDRASDEANEESIQKIEKETETEKDGGEVNVTDSIPEAITNKEEEATGEEKLEATVETNEVEKVSEIPESSHEQITEQPREVSGAAEHIDGSKYEEEAKSTETVTPAFEDAYSPDNAVTETEEDSAQKIEKENEAEKDGGEVVVTDTSPEVITNKEEEAAGEEKLEATVEASEAEKVSVISETAPEQIIEQPREISEANEHTDGSKYEEEEKRTETVSPAFEDAYHLDNAVIETEEDSAQKVEKEDEKEKEVEEVLAKDNNSEDEISQEEEKYAEEQHEAITEENEIEKVSESPETVDQQVITQLIEKLEETEPIDEHTYQREEEENVETITPVHDSEQIQVSDHTIANIENEDTEEKGLEEVHQAISVQQTIENTLETEQIDTIDQKAHFQSIETVKSVAESQDVEQKDIKQLPEISRSTEPTDESIGQQEKEESIEKATHELENEEAPGFAQAHTETECVASTQKIEDKDEDTKSSHPENKVNEEIESDQFLDAKVDANESAQKSEGAGQINQLVATVEDVDDASSSDHLYTKTESDSEEEVKEVFEQSAEELLGHPKENLEQIETTVKSIIQEEIEGNTEKVITAVNSKEALESDHAYSKTESEGKSSSTAIAEVKATEAGANPIKESSFEDTVVEELGKDTLEEQLSHPLIPEQNEDHKAIEYTEKKEIKGGQKDDSKQTSEVATETLESEPREVVSDPTITTSSRDIQDSVLADSLQEEYVILETADHTKTESPHEKEEEKLEETEEAKSKKSLPNLFQASVRRTNQEDPVTEKSDTKGAEEAEAEEEEEQGHVEDSGDVDSKAQNKKHSHNLLSGVGSKVKHSLDKVKKAITGKSKPK